jgi:hypothetical protein
MRFRDVSDKGTASVHQICANFGKSATETSMTRQAFGEESMNCTLKFHTHQDRKRRNRLRAKSRACSSFFFGAKGFFTKNSSWQAKQSFPHTTVSFYYDYVKMCEDFAPNFSDERTGCCITTPHRPTLSFSSENDFGRSNMTVVPHPHQFPLFPPLKTKLKDLHIGIIEVMEAE